jgi:hypothetical protein
MNRRTKHVAAMAIERHPVPFGAISRDSGVMVRTGMGAGGIRKLSGSGQDAG